MGVSEQVLWKHIRNDQLGYRFRRQHPIGPYSLDFFCAKLRLCVEVDGEQHQVRQTQDHNRDQFLLEKGIVTIRIPSLELFGDNDMNVHEWVQNLRVICDNRRIELGLL